ncbi:sodium channel protein Nach-like isoform X1 [Helicoverpa zea]|uniref:sodium channel protein Nach-like isoform X1 n=1 Tax=Helicoverpa zea TaxID=7113 RepID=UPI001F57A3E1|nr:sodium channel protein Nach-like isoform X1 [Helicoverpa zea]XP_047025989.1 sodium channel protein Nach-like isoform X1 [Helicoverpa zea]
MSHKENRSNSLLGLKDKIQYLSDKCGLQWLGYVFTPAPTPLFKRLFWLATITACCACSAVVLRGALALYTTDAVSYSVETDYLEWDTPFPALTVCEEANPAWIKKYLVQNNLPASLATFSQEVSFRSVKFCRSCVSCEMGKTCVQNFLELVNGIRKKCDELLTDCWWDGKHFPCCERFHPIATEFGKCFVFNSRWTGDENIININRQTGLPSLVFSATQSINIWIHSPDDMITMASENILGFCGTLHRITDFEVTLKAEHTISDVSVQLLSSSNRDCLFTHERPEFAHLWPFARYSYSACIMYSRAFVQAEACNCTHHFMPQIGNIPTCDFDGLVCLHKAKKEDLSTEQYHCPMACEEIIYTDIHVACPRQSSNVPEELLRRGTRGRVSLANHPSLRVRRQAIRELLGLVVDVGGVIGVFFGASLLSFIEVIYILFIRRYT